ncbi:MAG TPA: hypothetical protein VFR15_07010 [Chloroflexia bacterium]|nr:hypothetical protein [Chloroflexia bacterium]
MATEVAVGKRGAAVEIAAALALFAVVALLSWATQKPISHNGGRGWDGVEYHAMAEQIEAGQPLLARAPHVYRPGVPLLVALLPGEDTILKFGLVNLFAAGLSVALFVVWLRLYVGVWWVRALLVVLYVTMWHAPTRFVFFYPVYIDPWFVVCVLGGLIVVHRLGRDRTDLALIALLSAITFAGVLFREAALALPAALLTRDVPRLWTRRLPLDLVPLGAGAVALWLARSADGPFRPQQSHPYELVDVAIRWLYDKPPPTIALAWFTAFGPVLVLAIFFAGDALRFLGRYPFMATALGTFSVAGWLGGVDTERLMYWTFPVVYAVIGVVIARNAAVLASVPLVVLLAATQVPAQRLLWVTPDYPNPYRRAFMFLTPFGNEFNHLNLYSWHSPRAVSGLLLAEYLALALVLAGWLAYRRAKLARQVSE